MNCYGDLRALSFTHETKFDFDQSKDYEVNRECAGPVFSTTHNGISYKWQLIFFPGGRYRIKRGEDDSWVDQQHQKNVIYACIKYLGGPREVIRSNHVLFVKSQANVREMCAIPLAPNHVTSLSALVKMNEIAAAHWSLTLEPSDKRIDNGQIRLGVEIEIPEKNFHYDFVIKKKLSSLCNKDGAVQIRPVPTFLWKKVDTEPPYAAMCYKIVVGPERKTFFLSAQVLDMNSKYFRNILRSSIQDIQECEFLDKDPIAMRTVLLYIYRKELSENFSEIVESVLPIAHEFLLHSLVLECEKVMVKKLKSDNDVKFAVLAKKYDLSLLRSVALHSIAWRIDKILNCDEDYIEELQEAQLYDDIISAVSERARCCGTNSDT